MPNRRPGRPRDVELDDAIVEAAREVLSELGVDGVTFERVASRAGTTRPALYRRYPSRTDLVLDALASLRETRAPRLTGDHHRDLVAELTAFRDAITQAHSTALAGSMLLAATDDQTKAAYRDRVVAPRRRRLAQIIDAACADGALSAPPADRAVAVTMCTGSWYAYALAGAEPPASWPRRVADLVWRSLGG